MNFILFSNEKPVEENFVLSGDVIHWGLDHQMLVRLFDYIIYLYVPWPVRKDRITQRERERFGKRVLPGGDMYQLHTDFISWASNYEQGTCIGRNKASQKNFIDQVRENGSTVFEIEGEMLPQEIMNKVLGPLTSEKP